uniref:MCF.2 cell line derived transforming sequence a n=1 Tax=Esox lucius TaxID=8010 RepID=A0A6Q2YDR6_ESOLU
MLSFVLLSPVPTEVSVPITMKEVDGFIEKQVAYLSGGRGEDSSVIITLPEYSDFSDIPEESLAKVLTYLTFIPRARQPGVKFIIILDRRLDTWTSIKTALARIAASFPGNLHLVLVLRPTSFFQRTVTDLGFRFSQEDFMLKMPVVMLSSVTDLLRYIDENQLTSEFGGTLDYCHSDWIVLRTAIEGFAVTVKDIAQMLQAFGTEVAETELPNEGTTIVQLLSAHMDKYRNLKVRYQAGLGDCTEVRRHRGILNSWECYSGRSLQTQSHLVFRLLAQLREMESAFDGFFEKHHLKLQQCLQLLRYERSFQEVRQGVVVGRSLFNHSRHCGVRCKLDGEMLNACSFVSPLLFCDCSLLRQAQKWCDDGVYLLAQQLVDKFQSKEGAQAALKDIDRLLEEAPSLLNSGEALASVSCSLIQLHSSMEYVRQKTFEKHTVLQDMIQNRQSCLRKLADKHVRPIQLVAPRPENPPRSKSPLFSPKHSKRKSALLSNLDGQDSPDLLKRFVNSSSVFCVLLLTTRVGGGANDFLCLRRHVMKELMETERAYVEELRSVLLGYRAEMENPALAGLLPAGLQNKRDVLFGNMPEIYDFHSRIFLQDLEGCLETPERVGACFLERKENFQVYECYCQNKPRSESLWRQFSDCAFFQECQRNLEHKLGLDSYLLKPIQRLTKYQLLLKELLKDSPEGCEGSFQLQGALTAMLDLLKSVNDSMHQIAITGYQGELCDLGRVLMQGSFSVWISHKRGPTRMKELARFKPMQRHLFLYERALLFCKRREEQGGRRDRTPSYSFKHCLKMSAVGITENVKGDVKRFELWYSGREEVYLVQAPTVDVKMAWLNELRRILTNQQKLLKGLYVTHTRPCLF